MPINTAPADAIAAQIASQSWAQGVSVGSASATAAVPTVPAFLAPFIAPLTGLLDLVLAQPGEIYRVSIEWETGTGHLQEASDGLTRTAAALENGQQGLFIDAIAAALRDAAAAAHSVADWGKVGAQALQVALRICEGLRALVMDALDLAGQFGQSLGDFVFSWPWEIEKKAEAIFEFTRAVDDLVARCREQIDRVLQCFRDLLRLLLDLMRAMVPAHAQIEALLAVLFQYVPPGDAPVDVAPGQQGGGLGDIYNVSGHPYPGSDLEFEGEYDRGYTHEYDLGPTDLTTEELMARFSENFGHLFVPSRVGDNSQLNLSGLEEDQVIDASLLGVDIPGVTQGNILVTQVTEDGFVIRAMEGHPEEPGEVAFRITRDENGHARLQVTSGYDQTVLDRYDALGILDETNPAYAGFVDASLWSDMASRIRDNLRYGE
ncbi:hypothetical protein [Leucobacter musarum]|uniref:hypothetical protein n=1 Tax=Leucobacter musarum TaxID=1930747 RepID=UPI0006A7C481|nr:hypothetical protein [Leucobacter musarum]